MKEKRHNEFKEPVNCDGVVKRNGWTFESIDACTWSCPAWKCDKCGAEFWSWFDEDNGDEAYNTEEEDEEDEEYPDYN